MIKKFGRLTTVYIEPKNTWIPENRFEIGWAAPLPQTIEKTKEFLADLQNAIQFAEDEKKKMEE